MNKNDIIKKMKRFSLKERKAFRNILITPIKGNLDISVRNINTLAFNNIKNIGALLKFSENKLKDNVLLTDDGFIEVERAVLEHFKYRDFPWIVLGHNYFSLLDFVEKDEVNIEGALFLISELSEKISVFSNEELNADISNLELYVSKLQI
ncbi:MAG: hypothetical protein N4A44_04280 [Alphaproteobacteria bacterium]|jgi:hypothetical protein|nr:hypothetical protein [Alphaproteobacteria bacterium]